MTTPSPTRLDAFEAALLTKLRELVSEAATVGPDVRPAPGRRPRERQRRRWYVAAALTAAAAVALALLVPGLVPTPAYAVSGGNGREVKVRVTRLEGADGLERALQQHGIPADVNYLPAGKKCAPGRYIAVDPHGLTLSVGADRFEVTIPAHAVGPGETFVLSASVVPLANGVRASVDYGIAAGTVGGCRVVDAP